MECEKLRRPCRWATGMRLTATMRMRRRKTRCRCGLLPSPATALSTWAAHVLTACTDARAAAEASYPTLPYPLPLPKPSPCHSPQRVAMSGSHSTTGGRTRLRIQFSVAAALLLAAGGRRPCGACALPGGEARRHARAARWLPGRARRQRLGWLGRSWPGRAQPGAAVPTLFTLPWYSINFRPNEC